jgi:hypothetical protein
MHRHVAMARENPRALVLLGVLALVACSSSAIDPGTHDGGPTDASTDAACAEGCHWDCFGGSECVFGEAWVNAFAPRACCTFQDPWPDPGPECSVSSYPCKDGACGVPDPRYRVCVEELNRSVPCLGECEQLRLYCTLEGAAKSAGAVCENDLDCRPAAEGVARLRCEHSSCVDDVRPAPPTDYGDGCGLPDDFLGGNFVGEGAVHTTAARCSTCQVARAEGGCLRQGCSLRCTYDEDCPAGSICLCSDGDVGNYCAPATDRTTPEGRAAGLPACAP